MRGRAARACLIAALIVTACSAVFAGEVSGTLLNPKGLPVPHIFNSVNIAGSNPSGGTFTSSTDNAGIYYNPGLAAGIYSQGFSEKENYELLYFQGLNVPASGNTWNIVQFSPASFCYGTEWFAPWHTSYSQSFRATGDNVISVGLRTAGADEGSVQVQILSGEGPGGTPIGPARALAVSTTNGQCAYWSAGEVPTVPGQMYTARFTLAGGGQLSPWYQTVKTRMRDETPDSRTWVDSGETSQPLEMTVNQDDAGIINTMCCARHSTYTLLNQYAGQTFTARGTHLLAVSWMTDSTSRYAVSIHDGAGGGSGGTQIGPTKYVNGVAWDGRTVVTFGPTEVATTPGHVYYVKIRLASGAGFVLYDLGAQNLYSGGNAYADGVSQSAKDFALGIYEEKYNGSLDQQKISITNFRVDTITSTTAVVRWSTNIASDSTVDYSRNTPYTSNAYDSALTQNHAVTLTGLAGNRMYHIRATSRASGAKSGVSKDIVFVTAPAVVNALPDPSFEGGAFAANRWVKYGTGDIRITPYPWLAGAGPHTGTYGLAGGTNNATVKGGAYQRVPATNGAQYRLSAWVYTYTEGDYFSKGYQAIMRIGIDPTGGTDPNSTGIVWSPYTNSPDTWTQIGMQTNAAADYITVFIYGGNDNATTWAVWSCDDVVLTGPGPTVMALNQAVANYPDDAYVQVNGVVCTGTPTDSPNYYVETADRSIGIRVAMTETMSIGEQVSLAGYMRTRNTGERLLNNATVVSRSGSAPIKPICARPRSLGGTSPGAYCPGIPGTLGPYNVGTLMAVCGKVAISGSNVYVNDGSMPGNGVRIDTNSLTTTFQAGKTVRVTGIIRPEGTPGAATIVVDPRTDADVRVW